MRYSFQRHVALIHNFEQLQLSLKIAEGQEYSGRFCFETNSKVHAETCMLVQCCSRGCVAFLLMFVSNFLGRCSNHENTQKNTWKMSTVWGGWIDDIFCEAICSSGWTTRPQQRSQSRLTIAISGLRLSNVLDFLQSVKEFSEIEWYRINFSYWSW